MKYEPDFAPGNCLCDYIDDKSPRLEQLDPNCLKARAKEFDRIARMTDEEYARFVQHRRNLLKHRRSQ